MRTVKIVASVLGGFAIGVLSCWYLYASASRASATASILAAGESLRSDDLINAMRHAQTVVHDAPDAYDGYQLVGEVYRRQGYQIGAASMFEMAIGKLRTGGAKAMLVEDGVTSVATAEEHLRQKLQLVQ